MNYLFAHLMAYLCGSIPFGLLVGQWVKGIDIREHGSKNIGTTNVFRVLGRDWGMVVFLLDAFKGYVGVMTGSIIALENLGSPISYGFAVAAILGHVFPVWLKFKGGKGVATSLGVFLAVTFVPTLITFGVWCGVFAWSHTVSISSLIAAIVFPITSVIAVLLGYAHPTLIAVSLLLCGFIFYTHRENIKRIRKGEEKKLF
jgi:acyl phosphate:glycerol-3-phosphate acyltransferase